MIAARAPRFPQAPPALLGAAGGRPGRGRRRGAEPWGFSLIEVLIAMLVLSLGAASILSLFAAGASTHRRAMDRMNSALVAEEVFAAVQALYTAERTPDAILDELKKRLPEEISGYQHEETIYHPGGEGWAEHELYVKVALRWVQGGSDRVEAFHTVLLPRHVPGADRK